MIASFLIRTLFAAILAGFALVPDARAQAQPSAAAVKLAREIIELKGALTMFDTVIAGVVEYHKKVLLTANPNMQKDLDEVSSRLIKEFTPRRSEIQTEIARGYASRFTEPELKEILALYKTPLGKKLIVEEAKAVDEATKRVDAWAAKYAEQVMTRIRAEMKKKGHNLL
jgi:hypothetical protein